MEETEKKVSGTNIYVLTNNNDNGNCSIIAKMLEKYVLPKASMEIFLKQIFLLCMKMKKVTNL